MKLRNKTFPKSPHAIVTTGTLEDFWARSRERAKKLDRGERLPDEIRITFEDPRKKGTKSLAKLRAELGE